MCILKMRISDELCHVHCPQSIGDTFVEPDVRTVALVLFEYFFEELM